MDFTQAEHQRQQLSDQLSHGQITPEAYTAAINAIRVTDTTGKWWQPDPTGPGWLCWDGKTWNKATPPSGGPAVPGLDLMSVDEFRKISKDVPLARRPQKWWDFLSILGGVVAAGLWFLYGGLREGFDVLSAILMIAIPVVLVLFRTNIDEILQPLQPTRKQFPRLILIVVGILSPFLTAWILYNIIHISQYPLMQANLIVGSLVSYAIVRDPAHTAGGARSGKTVTAAGVSIIFCILILSVLVVPVMADDCTRDPLNAQDCLRTGGFAEFMAGLVAAILAGLINGPAILQSFLQGAFSRGSGGPMSQAQLDACLAQLNSSVQATIDQKIKDGYYVRNASLISKLWNNTIGYVKNEALGTMKGGQCGEFGKWGMDWAKEPVEKIFGKDVIIDDITIYQNPLINHRAVKIILPDGQRYVLDYWEGVSTGKASILPEATWINNWQGKVGFNNTADIHRTYHEQALESLIRNYGEEKGIAVFRSTYKQSPGKANAVVNSYKTNPWFNPKPPEPMKVPDLTNLNGKGSSLGGHRW
jgi:hypothetical protein